MIDLVVQTHETGEFTWDEMISIDRVFPREDAERLRTLTPREREVLELVAHDLSNQEIAERLFIEVGTVKNHVHSILKKLNVNSRVDAAAYLAVVKTREKN